MMVLEKKKYVAGHSEKFTREVFLRLPLYSFLIVTLTENHALFFQN